MSWEIRKNLHLDVAAPYGRVLLTSGTDSSLLQPPPDFVHGDRLPIRIYFWKRVLNGGLEVADPGADTSLILSARPDGVPAGSGLLFQTSNFVQVSPGVWEGALDLGTSEFSNHLNSAPSGAKIVTAELEVRDAVGSTKRFSLQFPITARPQVYDNQDAPSPLPDAEDWLAARLESYAPPTSKPTDAFSLMRQSEIETMDWSRCAQFVYNKTGSAAPSASVKTSTGYARAVRWDGTLSPVVGGGNPAASLSVNFGDGPTPDYQTAHPKFFALVPCDDLGEIEGDLTEIVSNGQNTVAFAGKGLVSLRALSLNGNNLTAFSGEGLIALEELDLSGNPLRDFDGEGMDSLLLLSLSSTLLGFLSVANLPSLLQLFTVASRRLTSIIGTPSLSLLFCQDSALTSIDMRGAALSYGSYGYGSDIGLNQLSAEGLEAFYDSLGVDVTANGIINIAGNPGAASADHIIATSKGYTIVGA